MRIYKISVLDGFKYIVDEKYNPTLNRLLQSNSEINEQIIYRCSVSSTDSNLLLSDFNPTKIPVFSERAYRELFPFIKDDIYRPVKCVYGKDDSEIGEAYGIRAKQIDCLDYKKSKYKCIGENLIIVSRYVFDVSKIGNSKLFRIPKCPFVFATETFVELVKNARLVGFGFSLKYDGLGTNCITIPNQHKFINKYWECNESLDTETVNELHSNIRCGQEILGINELSNSLDVVEKIANFVNSLKKDEIDFSIPLGVILGDAISREYHWKWGILGHDASNTVIVVKSPRDFYFIDPINIISRIITKKRENNLVLLFNMLAFVENNTPLHALEEIV